MCQSAEGTICINPCILNRSPLQGSGFLIRSKTQIAFGAQTGRTFSALRPNVRGKVPTAPPVSAQYEMLGNDGNC